MAQLKSSRSIDKTKTIDIPKLEKLISDLFEPEPLSYADYIKNGDNGKEYPIIFLCTVRDYIIHTQNLTDCCDLFSINIICIAALRSRAFVCKPSYFTGDQGITLIGLKFKDSVDLEFDTSVFRFRADAATLSYREVPKYVEYTDEYLDEYISKSGYHAALAKSPCAITEYIREKQKTWRSLKSVEELHIYDKMKRAEKREQKKQAEIDAGIRDPDTGRLVNAEKPGPKPIYTPEEAAANIRESKRNYYHKIKQAEIDAGLRDPDTGGLLNPKKRDPKTNKSPEDLLAEATRKRQYAKEYAARQRKIAMQAEIDAGLRDPVTGKLIK